MKRTRNLKVKKLSQLSPNMLRLTFTSKDLLDFPENEEGGYIKFSYFRVFVNFVVHLSSLLIGVERDKRMRSFGFKPTSDHNG